MRNKNDAEDILVDAKVDGNRIYETLIPSTREKTKRMKDLWLAKYQKLNLIINFKLL